MTRTTSTNFTGGNSFPIASEASDLFYKEDVQAVARALDLHNHTDGLGLGAAIQKISEQELSSVAAFVDFSLPTSGFREVRISWQTQLDGNTAAQEMRVRLNSDTGNNYLYSLFHGSFGGGTMSGFGADPAGFVRVGNVTPSSVANGSSAGEVCIPEYRNTIWYKSIDSKFFNVESAMSGAQTFAGMGHGTWKNTAAVTAVRLYPASNNFRIGSVFRLYGVV